jgi:hypothetical protein
VIVRLLSGCAIATHLREDLGVRWMNKGVGARLRRRYYTLQTAHFERRRAARGFGLEKLPEPPFRLQPSAENLERVKAGLRVRDLAYGTTWKTRTGVVYHQRRHFGRSGEGPRPVVPPSGADPLGVGRLTGSKWDGPTLDFEARKTWIAVSEFTGALHLARWEGEPFLGYGGSSTSIPSSIWLTGDLRLFALTNKSPFPGAESDFNVAVGTGEVYDAWLMRPKPLDEFSWSDWQALEKTMRARVDYLGAIISGPSLVLTELGIHAGLGDE